MKKKFLAMVFASFMLLSACGGNTTDQQAGTSTDTGTDTSAEETQAEETPQLADSGAVGDYDVTIGDCAFGEDYEGNKMIVVNYDFTNNSDEAIMPLIGVTMQAFQDGIELELAIAMDDSVYDAAIGQKEVKPGATLTGCQNAYVLTSDSPVEVEVSETFGDVVLTKTFEVQ